jgi:hypothetical protein
MRLPALLVSGTLCSLLDEIERVYDGKHEKFHNSHHTHIKKYEKGGKSAFLEFYTHCVNKDCELYKDKCVDGMCGSRRHSR